MSGSEKENSFMRAISYNRRQVCQMGLSGLASLALLGAAGCGGSGGAATPTQTKTLQLIFWGPASRNKLTRKAIDLFHSAHPEIDIHSEFTDFSSYWNKLSTEIAGGTIPDLIQMDMKYVSQYVKQNLLLDMTNVISDKSINLSDFDQSLLASSEDNKVVYGIPLGGNYECLIYDADLLKQAGVQAPPANMTWDAFGTYAGEISKALAKERISGTVDASGDIAVFEIWLRQRGKEMFTTDGKLGYDAQDVGDWFNYWSGLRKSGACAPAAVQATVSSSSGPATSLLIEKKVAICAAHSNQFESYQTLTKHQLMLQNVPTGPQPGQYLKASMLMSISSKTKYTKEAASFIDFIINDPGGVKALGLDRGVPGGEKARAALTPTLTAPQKAVMAFVDQLVKSDQNRPKNVLDPAGAGDIQTALGRVSQSVSFGKTSISAGATTFMSDSQKALARA
jgi:multiple sugar transport system substrate-binding protein